MEPTIRAVIDDCFLEGIIDEKIFKSKYKSRQGELDAKTKSNIRKAVDDFKNSVSDKKKFQRLAVRVSGWMLYIDGVDAGMRNGMTIGDPVSMLIGNTIHQGGGYIANRTKVTSLLNKAFKKYGFVVKLHSSKLVNINKSKTSPYYDQHYEYNIYRTGSMSKEESAQFDDVCNLFLDESDINYYGDFFYEEVTRING